MKDYRMEFTWPGLSLPRCVSVKAEDMDEARDECLTAIYDNYSHVTDSDGKLIVPIELSLTQF